jgi:hypothetical protein
MGQLVSSEAAIAVPANGAVTTIAPITITMAST